jgi:hypothetical protein
MQCKKCRSNLKIFMQIIKPRFENKYDIFWNSSKYRILLHKNVECDDENKWLWHSNLTQLCNQFSLSEQSYNFVILIYCEQIAI